MTRPELVSIPGRHQVPERPIGAAAQHQLCTAQSGGGSADSPKPASVQIRAVFRDWLSARDRRASWAPQPGTAAANMPKNPPPAAAESSFI